MKQTRRQHLTPEEMARFVADYPHHPNRVICERYGISEKSATMLAYRHGLKKTSRIYADGERVDAIIREKYPAGVALTIIARECARTEKQIMNRAHKLKLKRPKHADRRRSKVVVTTPKPRPLPSGRDAWAVAPAIIPPTVRVQIGPSAAYDARYQLPPGERLIGGFASLGIGRYL